MRCDRCPAEATTSYLTPGGPLVFCDHHTREHQTTLTALNCPSSPLRETPLYPPGGWEGCGYGLPVNGPDRHHCEGDWRDRL